MEKKLEGRRRYRRVDLIIYGVDVPDFWQASAFIRESCLGHLQSVPVADYAADRPCTFGSLWSDQAGTASVIDCRIIFPAVISGLMCHNGDRRNNIKKI